MKATGYLVMESCDDYEQALALLVGDKLPPGGVLGWAGAKPVALFSCRYDARNAIDRTEHYRLAYGRPDMPEKKQCRVVAVAAVTDVGGCHP